MHAGVRTLVVAVVLASTALAGCLDAANDAVTEQDASQKTTIPEGWAKAALPFGKDHDHADPAQHKGLSTSNFEVIGWNPLVTEYHGKTSGGYFCGEGVDTGDARYAFVSSFLTDVAFVVVEVSDPAAPKMVGELVLPRTHVYDLAATPDAKYVVLGTSLPDSKTEGSGKAATALGTSVPFFRDACTGEERPVASLVSGMTPEQEVPFGSGVVLVDVTDPANPVVADYRPLPVLGAHSVFATNLDGETLVLASVTNLVHHGSYYVFYGVTETPNGAKLAEKSVYRPVAVDPKQPVGNGHIDGWIQKHPVTDQTLAYLADWSGGLSIVDVTSPVNPVPLGYVNDVPGGQIHGALPLDTTWDDKHYTFIGQEYSTRPGDRTSGIIAVVDTTDPSQPKTVGAWTLPVDAEWSGGFTFSTHYFRLVEKTLFVAHYHGGVWALDLTDPTHPVPTGVFIPDKVPENPPGDLIAGWDKAPFVLDLEAFPNGDLAVWDAPSGLYMLRFDATNPAPAPAPRDIGYP